MRIYRADLRSAEKQIGWANGRPPQGASTGTARSSLDAACGPSS